MSLNYHPAYLIWDYIDYIIHVVIPWFVCLYEEVIHELQQVDYLLYRWTNLGITNFSTLIRVDLAQYEIFHAKVCDFWQGLYNVKIKC